MRSNTIQSCALFDGRLLQATVIITGLLFCTSSIFWSRTLVIGCTAVIEGCNQYLNLQERKLKTLSGTKVLLALVTSWTINVKCIIPLVASRNYLETSWFLGIGRTNAGHALAIPELFFKPLHIHTEKDFWNQMLRIIDRRSSFWINRRIVKTLIKWTKHLTTLALQSLPNIL